MHLSWPPERRWHAPRCLTFVVAWPVVLVALGCGEPRDGASPITSSHPRALVSVPAAGPAEPVAPPIVDVSQVQKQPDGTFRRICGPVPEASRLTMEQARRRRLSP